MPQSSWMGRETQSLGRWVACLVFWRSNSASGPAFASLRQLSQLLPVMLTVMFLVHKHLIWIARQWLHSTSYRFSLCSLLVWPLFRVGAESRWLWSGKWMGQSRHLCFPAFMSNSGPLVAVKGSPCCPAVSLAPSARTVRRILAPATAPGAAAEQEEMSLSRHKSIACVFILSISFKWKTIWTVSEHEGYNSACCYLYCARHYKCLTA